MIVGTMRTPGGLQLDLTDHDALWLARAVMGEGVSDVRDIVSTMLRRWSWVSDQSGRPVWATLTELVVGRYESEAVAGEVLGESGSVAKRGYSQPVSVQWRNRGTDADKARRLRHRTRVWSQIPNAVRSAVYRTLSGELPLTSPGAVHFADSRVSAARLRSNPIWRVVHRGRNWFLSVGASRRHEPTITPGPGAPSSSSSGKGSVVGGLAVTTLLLLVLL